VLTGFAGYPEAAGPKNKGNMSSSIFANLQIDVLVKKILLEKTIKNLDGVCRG
jgi:hypothetical protein